MKVDFAATFASSHLRSDMHHHRLGSLGSLVIASFVASALAGCTGASDDDLAATAQDLRGISFEGATPVDVAGQFSDGINLLRFTSHAEWGRSITATIVVGATPIIVGFAVGDRDDTMSLDIRGELSDRERVTLRAFTDEFTRWFPVERDSAQPAGALVRAYGSFLSDWTLGATRRPIITTIPARPRDVDPTEPPPPPPGSPPPTAPPPPTTCGDTFDNDSVSVLPQCCNGGAVVPWDHDAPGECFHTMTNTCGDDSIRSGEALATNCPGRCGSNCWGAIPFYTQDCLEHDLCLMHHPGQPSVSLSASCGDELLDALDDLPYIIRGVIGWGHTLPLQTGCFF